MLRPLLLLASALVTGAVQAEEPASCTLPGEQVVEDASGDHQTAALGEGFGDILTLHMAEPAGGNNLVVTFKVADLGLMPPNTGWILRFITDLPPAPGHEYFLAMVTDPAGSAHFVHGVAAPPDDAASAAPLLLFTPAGELDSASNFKADGTITMVLDKSQVAGLEPGGFVFQMLPLVNRISPTDGSMPFAYGPRGLGDVSVPYDVGGDGLYEIVGNADCGGGKSRLLGAGAFAPWTLLLLLLPALRRALLKKTEGRPHFRLARRCSRARA